MKLEKAGPPQVRIFTIKTNCGRQSGRKHGNHGQLQDDRQKEPEAEASQAQVPQFLSRQCRIKNLIETT